MSKGRLYLWCDTETTGLNHKTNHLLEVAFILTDTNLHEVSRFERVVRPTTSDWVYYMNRFVTDMHLGNGLIEDVLRTDHYDNSPERIDAEAEKWLIEEATGKKMDWKNYGTVIKEQMPNIFLAGSTVEFDARVLERFMHYTFKHLHYRLLNVSSIKEALLDLRPEVVHEYRNAVPKDKAHRAMTDIEVSIAEFKHYIQRGALGGNNE